MVPFYDFKSGSAPLLISMPHCGTHIPPDLAGLMTPAALEVPDTDFHLPQLYDFAAGLGASVLSATHSRYVIDLNRAPDGTVLYPGASNTELCPLTRFDHAPVYRDGRGPDAGRIGERIELYWKPYHRRIASELERIRAQHGYALLFDAHSIVSECPRFFEGCLTDINLGTGGGTSADPALGDALVGCARQHAEYTSVLNGRFKGGYITRHYGNPGANIHAAQLELAMRTYMQEKPPFAYETPLAERVRVVLRELLRTMLEWKR